MKKLLFYSPAIILTFLFTTPHVEARTTINVNSSTNGEDSRVRVESNSNQSSDVSLSQNNSETKIRLEQNGEVKTFEATGDEDITWDSEDGSASIRVNQSQSASVQENGESPDTATKQEDDEEESDEDRGKNDDVDKSSDNSSPLKKIVESIKDFISSFLS